MNLFIGQKPYFVLSTTCAKILSWMIEIWMENHLVSDSNCNTVNLQSPSKFTRNDKYIGLTYSVCDTIPHVRIGIEEDN